MQQWKGGHGLDMQEFFQQLTPQLSHRVSVLVSSVGVSSAGRSVGLISVGTSSAGASSGGIGSVGLRSVGASSTFQGAHTTARLVSQDERPLTPAQKKMCACIGSFAGIEWW